MIDFTAIVFQVIHNLNTYVFGNMTITCISIVLFFTLVSLLIQIPLPYSIAMQIPLIVVLTAYGFISILTGGLFSAIYLILALWSFINGICIAIE